MPIFTYVARVNDGMMLVASMPSQADDRHAKYKAQAKQILKRLASVTDLSTEMRIDTTDGYVFDYMIADGVCFLSLEERSYPARLAFTFLHEIHQAFVGEMQREYGNEWRKEVETVGRPYAFIKFDRVITQRLKQYSNPEQSNGALAGLNANVSEATTIMKKNIGELLNRGAHLDEMSNISRELVSSSKSFEWGARKRNMLESLRTYLPIVVCILIVLIVVYVRFLW